MNSNKWILGKMADVKIIISALWVARMLSSLQGDTTRLSDPVTLRSMVEETGVIAVSTELLLAMSVIMAVPILMSFLSLTLRYPAFRWSNRIAGIFMALFDLVFLGLAIFVWHSVVYEVFWSIAYLVFTSLVVWYSWKLPKREA